MKLVIVTNIPAPYRVPIYNRVAKEIGDDFLVVFCARSEPNRQWDMEPFEFNHTYLKQRFFTVNQAFIHNNPDVLRVLRRFKPDVVITTGFNPTHLLAWAYTLVTKARHVPMTDGWLISEQGLSTMHKVARKTVYCTSRVFIGAGKGSLDLYRSYGIGENALFRSHLCIDNGRFATSSKNRNRPFDLMYSGQIIEGKMPEFFVKVVKQTKMLRGRISVLVIGDGSRREIFLNSLKALGADVLYAGFVSQQDLPAYYSKAKMLLFTTRCDAWGIVANEALASGTPVITTPYAGVAHDLVIDGKNGYVIDTNASLWAARIIGLLQDEPLLEQMRLNAVSSVAEFNFDNAARGIIEAAKRADGRSSHRKNKQ